MVPMLRVGWISFFLNRGYGLLTVALIAVGLPMLASIVRGAVVPHSLPLNFSRKYVDRDAPCPVEQ
jgi:hypothetical protein